MNALHFLEKKKVTKKINRIHICFFKGAHECKAFQDKPDCSRVLFRAQLFLSGLNEYFVFVWPAPPLRNIMQ
jgi:hypothetical protein